MGIGMFFFIFIAIMVVIGLVLTLSDDSLALLLTGMMILLIAMIIFVRCWYQDAKSSESQTVQEQETESEDLSQPVTNMENVAYANGEVAEKLSNNIIQVSVHEETYKILVGQSAYDTIEVGDTISCIVYLDENNNIVSVVIGGEYQKERIDR